MNLFSFFERIQIAVEGATDAVNETAIATDTGIEQQTIMDVILDSWYIMGPLAVCSVLAVYIFIERFLTIKRALNEERDFMAKIKDYVNEGKLDAAKQLCASTDNPVARMVEKGLMRIGKPLPDINAAIENVAKMEIYRLEARLSILATIAGVAPMIGFLGTVLGMMNTFGKMRTEGVEIASLSGGINEAMVTTVGGLVVGIIAYVAYNYLISKVEKVIQKMEGGSMEFMDILEAPGN